MEMQTIEEAQQTVETTSRKIAAPNPRGKLLFGIAGVAVLAALTLWIVTRGKVSTDDAQVDGHVVAVSPRIFGRVSQLLVQDNQLVHAGDVLVVLDDHDQQAAVAQAEAALALAQSRAKAADVNVPYTAETTSSTIAASTAQLEASQAQQQRAETAWQQASTSSLAEAQAEVAAREASNARAQADLARVRPLLKNAEISKQEFDAYKAAADVAASQLDAARQHLASVRQGAVQAKESLDAARAQVSQEQAALARARAGEKEVDIQSADAASARAAVEQAAANLKTAQLNLGYTRIVAPVDGYITHRTVEVGQVVQAGQELLVLSPTAKAIWITADFKETQLAGVHKGQKAEIDIDMYGHTLTGHVDSIAGATGERLSLLPPENATGNYVKVVQRIPVKILVDSDPNYTLRPGMSVEATILTR